MTAPISFGRTQCGSYATTFATVRNERLKLIRTNKKHMGLFTALSGAEGLGQHG